MSKRGLFWLSTLLTVLFIAMIGGTAFIGTVMLNEIVDFYPYIWFLTLASVCSAFFCGFLLMILENEIHVLTRIG